MILTEAEIENAFKWTQPVEKSTGDGKPVILRKSQIDDESLAFWKANQHQLAAVGIHRRLKWKSQTEFEFVWWRDLPPEELQRRKESLHASSKVSGSTAIPCPDGCEFLPYQIAGIEYMLARNGTVLADEMGLGKTVQAIGYINSHPNVSRVLVIVPAKLTINWFREIRKWLTKNLSIGMVDSESFPSSDVVIISYSMLDRWRERLNIYWDLIVCDEAQFLKNPKSKRTRVVIGYRPSRKEAAQGAVPSSGIPKRRVILITGTPIMNHPMEFWGLLSYCDPTHWNSWFKYAQRYCGARNNGGRISLGEPANLLELQKLARETCMVRRLKKDVQKELPAKRRSLVILPADGDIARVVARETEAVKHWEESVQMIEARIELARAEEGLDDYRAAVKALGDEMVKHTELEKLRHATAHAKLPMVVDFVEDMLENVGKVMIGAYHRDIIEELHRRLSGYGALKVYGKNSTTETQAAVDAFQNDESQRVFIINFDMAVGMTLTAASNAVAAEIHFVPGVMSQWEDRCLSKNTLVLCPLSVHSGNMSLIPVQKIQAGDTVLTHNGNEGLVTSVSKHEHRGMMTSIKYVGWPDPLVCTFDHKILIKRMGNIEWVMAHEVLPSDSMVFPKQRGWTALDEVKIKSEWRIYDRVEVQSHCKHSGCNLDIEARGMCRVHYRELLREPQRPPKPKRINPRYVRLPDKIKIDNEWLYLFGWYGAEGFSSLLPGKSKFISFSANEKERPTLNRIARIINSIGVKTSIYSKKTSKGIELRAWSGELAFWFRDWFGHTASHKSLPAELLNLPPEQASVFLRGYTDGDGYQRKKTVEWVSASKTLCYQMCLLAIRSGFIPTMRRGSVESGSHWIGSYTKFGKPFNERLNDQDGLFIYRPVLRVETYNSKETVYDITVENDHSFTTGFSTVHNCHRIGQRDSVNVWHLALDGSYDQRAITIMLGKQDMIDKALNDPLEDAEMVSGSSRLRLTRRFIEQSSKLVTQSESIQVRGMLSDLVANCANMQPVDRELARLLLREMFLSPRKTVVGQELLKRYI